MEDKEKKIITKTKKLLIEIIKNKLKNIPEIAVCFSGSLDSSLVAYITKRYTKTKISLYTIGYKDSYDYKLSKISAKLLNLSKNLIFINLADFNIKQEFDNYIKLSNDNNKVSISYTLPFYILIRNINQKNIITGHGADTLFGGFYKYTKLENVKNEVNKCYKEFISNLPKKEYKIAEEFNKNLIIPFSQSQLSTYVLNYPENLYIKDDIRKYILRKVAIDIGLPKDLIYKPKKSFQYSTGIIKKLKIFW